VANNGKALRKMDLPRYYNEQAHVNSICRLKWLNISQLWSCQCHLDFKQCGKQQR